MFADAELAITSTVPDVPAIVVCDRHHSRHENAADHAGARCWFRTDSDSCKARSGEELSNEFIATLDLA